MYHIYLFIYFYLLTPFTPQAPTFGSHQSVLCSYELAFFFFLIPHIRDHTVFVFLCLWLTSLSIMFSKSIHVEANGKIFFFSGWIICSRASPHSSVSKESACSAGDLGLIPGSGRFLGEGNGNPFQYSCLENPMNREAWQATVHGVTKSWTWLKWLSMHAHTAVELRFKHESIILWTALLCYLSVETLWCSRLPFTRNLSQSWPFY